MKGITVKLAEEDLKLLEIHAVAAGEKPSAFARKLLLQALRGGQTQAGETNPAPSETGHVGGDDVRKAVWCLICALSPDLNEDRAAEFVSRYFDAAPAMGYRPAVGEGKP